MQNNNLQSINSVCTNTIELVKSDDFIRGVEIILGQVKSFDKDKILFLFKKIKNDQYLDEDEKKELLKFMNDKEVSKKGQELLSKLKNVLIDTKLNNSTELLSFGKLLNDIFSQYGYKKVKKYIEEIADVSKSTLNAYEGMFKVQIEVNLEKREIYLDKENFKINSGNWKKKKIGGIKVKINPEGDITEYLDGELVGEQLFTWEAAMRECKKIGKRLPFADDNNPEFQSIIEKIGVSELKLFPGFRYNDLSNFSGKGVSAYFWSASTDGNYACAVLNSLLGYSKGHNSLSDKSDGLSVRLVKD